MHLAPSTYPVPVSPHPRARSHKLLQPLPEDLLSHLVFGFSDPLVAEEGSVELKLKVGPEQVVQPLKSVRSPPPLEPQPQDCVVGLLSGVKFLPECRPEPLAEFVEPPEEAEEAAVTKRRKPDVLVLAVAHPLLQHLERPLEQCPREEPVGPDDKCKPLLAGHGDPKLLRNDPQLLPPEGVSSWMAHTPLLLRACVAVPVVVIVGPARATP